MKGQAIDDKRLRESLAIRGICAAIMAMALPTIQSVNALLDSAGYPIRIVKTQANKNTNRTPSK